MLKICEWSRVCRETGFTVGNRFYTLQTSAKSRRNEFQQTVLLPRTNFPSHVKPGDVTERDQRIQKEARFMEFYEWQRDHVKGKEFVLHDGPPYANGKPHIGHAINKVLKDIILRSQAIQGRRVHFIPGWDCHGLPIEMVAMKNMKNYSQTMEIRREARHVAQSMSSIQRDAFKSWGVLGDWEKQCYYTYDVDYIINELQVFWKMYEKGLIYYDLKPVYWSPSSKSALAEAELVYKDHTSNAVTVRFETTQEINSEPVYLLVWTTTPWTLPLNKAVYWSTSMTYSLVKIPSLPGCYIIAKDLIDSLQQKLQKNVSILNDVSVDFMKNLQYKHPWNRDEIIKVFESADLKAIGTGLLHSVPAHGHEDFVMGLQNDLKVDCFVDENGCYTEDMGPKLKGLSVLEEGSDAVLEQLSSDVICTEKYSHSYPYDWRTNKPVIIRASDQWFIDTKQLKSKALECLEKIGTSTKVFKLKLQQRPYWCLSRQRTWGVPIPVFFHKKSKRPLISKNLIHHICHLFESHGPDIWWEGQLDQLFPDRICRELYVRRDDVVRSNDIMDIWFDSGVSWSHVLDGRKSEVYLEGGDQYSGWFQSSLLTSVALGNGAPFKRILTHGFAVDEHGRKMSKSLGNVVDPDMILTGNAAFGVDTLRWWVAYHSQQDLVPVSHSILKSTSETMQKLRQILRFLLGALNDLQSQDVAENCQLFTLDRYALNSCYGHYEKTMELYNSYNIHKVCSELLHFVTSKVSRLYISSIKDRLYCDSVTSDRRIACRYTINGILNTLCHVVAPILPHLAEEVSLYHPLSGGKATVFFKENPWSPPESWKDDSANASIHVADEIRREIIGMEKRTLPLSCTIQIEDEHYELLRKMQSGKDESTDSELTEILQVAQVRLKPGERRISLSPSDSSECPRCRRYTSTATDQLCTRCNAVVHPEVNHS